MLKYIFPLTGKCNHKYISIEHTLVYWSFENKKRYTYSGKQSDYIPNFNGHNYLSLNKIVFYVGEKIVAYHIFTVIINGFDPAVCYAMLFL